MRANVEQVDAVKLGVVDDGDAAIDVGTWGGGLLVFWGGAATASAAGLFVSIGIGNWCTKAAIHGCEGRGIEDA